MPSVRITDPIRKTILDRVIAHGFGKSEAALYTEEQQLAATAYGKLVPEQHGKTMALLPKNYFDMSEGIAVVVEGKQVWLRFGAERPVPAQDRRLILPPTDHFAQRVMSFMARGKALEAAKKAARVQARAVISSVRTVEKLVAVWPEIASFTADIAQAQKPVTALAAPIRDLNAALDLPPDTEPAPTTTSKRPKTAKAA